jgi:hypothetical protein
MDRQQYRRRINRQQLYNAMVAPLINYAIKGILWYQGESNAGKPAEYANCSRHSLPIGATNGTLVICHSYSCSFPILWM